MMRLLLSLLFSLVCCACVFPQLANQPAQPREISGILDGQTVLEGSIVMTGDVLVPVDSRLIIRPGTTILVRKSESTKIDPEYLSSDTELLVRGALVIEGNNEQRVSFLPEEALSGGNIGWAGIILDRATDTVIRSTTLMQPDTGVLILESSPEIIDNKIVRARYGIIAQGGEAKILGNEIVLGEGGIFCWNGTKAYLKDNFVIANNEEGIMVDRSSSPYVDRNTVSGNSFGLIIPENVPYDPTMISGNGENVRILSPRSEVQL